MNQKQLEYIVNEDRSYELNILDIEWRAWNYLSSEDQHELHKWEYLNKIPKGMFGK